MVFKVTCLALLAIGFVKSSVIPVDKCKFEDSACLKSAFNKMLPIFMSGMSDEKVEVLDPMQMDDLAFDLAGLKFTLTEATMKGMKSTVVENVDWNTKKKVLSIEYHLDCSVKGHYTADGRILILPITGDGQAKMKLKNLAMKLDITYDMVKDSNGKAHIKPKKYAFEFEIKDNAHYHLTNMFNGNKELSDTMLTFLNENWKQIATEFGGPMINNVSKKVFNNIVNFFDAVPIDEIAVV